MECTIILNACMHWATGEFRELTTLLNVEIIGYVGSIGLEALFKPPEYISDAVRFRWDRNGIRIQPVSTSGTHSGYSNRYKKLSEGVLFYERGGHER
jgi:hypothetical protein